MSATETLADTIICIGLLALFIVPIGAAIIFVGIPLMDSSAGQKYTVSIPIENNTYADAIIPAIVPFLLMNATYGIVRLPYNLTIKTSQTQLSLLVTYYQLVEQTDSVKYMKLYDKQFIIQLRNISRS